VRQVSWAQKHFSFADFDHLPASVFRLEMQLYVALDLIKEFIGGLDVKVQPGVRTMDDHDYEFFLMDDHPVGFVRRRKQVLVLVNPALQIIRSKSSYHWIGSIG